MDKTTISFEDLLQKAVISLHTKEQDILPSEKELKNQLSFSPAFYRKMKRLLHKRFFPQPPHAPVCKTHSRYFTRILVVAAILLAASVTAAAVFGLPELLHMLFEEKAALALPFAKPLHGVFELSKPLSTLPDAVQETPKIELKAAVADNSVLYIIYSVKDSTGQPLQGTYDFTNILFNIDLPEALPNSGYTYGPIVSDTPTQELLFLLRADCDATCIGKTAHLTLQNLKKQEDLDIKTAPLDFAALSKEGYIAEECQTVKKQSKQELEAFYDKIDHKTREEIDQMVNDQLEHQRHVPNAILPPDRTSWTFGPGFPGVTVTNAGFVEGFFELIIRNENFVDLPDLRLYNRKTQGVMPWNVGNALYLEPPQNLGENDPVYLCYYWDTRGIQTEDLTLEYGGAQQWVTVFAGSWKQSFVIESAPEAKRQTVNLPSITAEGMPFTIQQVGLSPFSVVLDTDIQKEENLYDQNLSISVERKDGTKVEIEGIRIVPKADGCDIKLPFLEPVDPLEISTIRCNDTTIDLLPIL